MIKGALLLGLLATTVYSMPSTVYRYDGTGTEVLTEIMPPIEHWGEPTVPWEVHQGRPPFLLHNTAVTLPFLVNGTCHIWIDPALYEVNRLAYATILFHEWAHCPEAGGNGLISWPGNHPGQGTADVNVEVFFAPWLEAWEAN